VLSGSDEKRTLSRSEAMIRLSFCACHIGAEEFSRPAAEIV
jgi:hypothetical protein